MASDTIRTLLAHAFPGSDIAVGSRSLLGRRSVGLQTDFETLEDLVEARA